MIGTCVGGEGPKTSPIRTVRCRMSARGVKLAAREARRSDSGGRRVVKLVKHMPVEKPE